MKNDLRKYFPMADKIVYLDNAALALKPNEAIEACSNFYNNYSVSTRTNDSPLGIHSNQVMKNLRSKIAFLTDANEDEVIFTSGTTDSLNKCAIMLSKILKKSDEIILHAYNHSSNFAPWINLAQQKGLKINIVTDEDILNFINKNTKIVALSQITNNYQIDIDMEKVYKKTQEVGAILINDAAQAIVYDNVSLKNCDIIAFSANKFYGPTGFGALIVKKDILNLINPPTLGGGSIADIEKDGSCIVKTSIEAFEPGTANLAAIYMFDKAIDFFHKHIGYTKSKQILLELSHYLYDQLITISNIEIYSKRDDHIILFNVKNVNAQDVAHYLGIHNIYVRAGIFCAHYLKKVKDHNSYVRLSLGVYNNKEDIDKFLKVLKNGGDFLVI
ncbi:aminotransferase class V-fold PLP-dependent enzyme [Mycoplasmopsis primatum]|uniref:aminotransferase class V-fold PLP-dependent enzyme n=1 Tax=Mycoplasmopsis primatum TaxID=55604 RepID=UPI000497C6B1|nr:aminotransferase class V-fold PLP-dependent enzyme [Mycoplasmopsis primatum]